MKRTIALFVIIVLVFVLSSVAYAANARRGKRVFSKVCKSCHTRGTEAGKLKPSEKTMAQWQRFIKKNKHKGGQEVLDTMPDKDKKNLQQFLLDYALDADTIETCG